MKRLAWSEVRSARQPGLKQELRVLIELLRVLPRPGFAMQLTILPSNIMVGTDGSVLVGAARLGGTEHQERYLAPEVQCGAEPMLPAAIYSVGALLFEAVTGHRFETRDHVIQELAGARAMARAAGLGARFWEIYLLEAAAKATDERPEVRWTSGSDFAEDLERVARDRIVTRAELGELVDEVLETRRSSRPPNARTSAPARGGPPPLPKRGRRRSSRSKLKKTSKPAMTKAPAIKPATSAGPPLPRSDGAEPQLPLITALRVPSRLKLPEGVAPAGSPLRGRPASDTPSEEVTQRAAPSSGPTAAEPAPDEATSAAPAKASAAPAEVGSSAPNSTSSAPPGATGGEAAASGARRSAGPSVVVRAGTASGLRSAVGQPVTTPPVGSLTKPAATVERQRDAFPHTGTLPGPMLASSDAVKPGGSEFSDQEDPTIPRHRTLRGDFSDQEDPTIPRHRTLQGPGDLRAFEEQFRIANERASAPDLSRHGTLVGLGLPAEVAGASTPAEPAQTPADADSPPRSKSPSGSEPNPSAASEAEEITTKISSDSQRSAESGPRFVFSPAPEPEWDSELPPSDGAQSGSSVTTHPPKRSWFGKAALFLVLVVVLALGTLEYYGQVVTRTLAGPPAATAPESVGVQGDGESSSESKPRGASATPSSTSAKPESSASNAEAIEVTPAEDTEDEDNASTESASGAPASEAAAPTVPAASAKAPSEPAKVPTPPRRAPVRRKARPAERDYGI